MAEQRLSIAKKGPATAEKSEETTNCNFIQKFFEKFLVDNGFFPIFAAF